MKRDVSKARASKKKKTGTKKAKTRAKVTTNECVFCNKKLTKGGTALFVEEEVGHYFCSEDCIVSYFTPEIERLEDEYLRKVGSHDFSQKEQEQLADLRWMTIEKPQEAWVEKTIRGQLRYTLISSFRYNGETISCVCICLMLGGQPSFLFLSFVTRDPSLVESYRKGEKANWLQPSESEEKGIVEFEPRTDRLAIPWTEDELYRAQLIKMRRTDDIPSDSFQSYEQYFDDTVNVPDEVWSFAPGDRDAELYHFIRRCPGESSQTWYIVVARALVDSDQMEILDAFPTRDPLLVDHYRKGNQQVSSSPEKSGSRAGSSGNRTLH